MSSTEGSSDWLSVTAQAQGVIDDAGLLEALKTIPDESAEAARAVSLEFRDELADLMDHWKQLITLIAARPAPIVVNLTIDSGLKDPVYWGEGANEKAFDPGFSGEVFRGMPWDKSWIPGWRVRRRKRRLQLTFDPPDSKNPKRFGCELVALGILGKNEIRLTTISLNVEPPVLGGEGEELYIFGVYPDVGKRGVAYAGTVPCIHCGRTLVCGADPCAQCSGAEDCGQA